MVNECGTTISMPLHIIVEACMGVDEAIGYKNAISLYPNPAGDIINIQLPENPNFIINGVKVYNALGQQVYTDSTKYTSISTTSFPTGMYIVKLATDKGGWQSKFIKK